MKHSWHYWIISFHLSSQIELIDGHNEIFHCRLARSWHVNNVSMWIYVCVHTDMWCNIYANLSQYSEKERKKTFIMPKLLFVYKIGCQKSVNPTEKKEIIRWGARWMEFFLISSLPTRESNIIPQMSRLSWCCNKSVQHNLTHI